MAQLFHRGFRIFALLLSVQVSVPSQRSPPYVCRIAASSSGCYVRPWALWAGQRELPSVLPEEQEPLSFKPYQMPCEGFLARIWSHSCSWTVSYVRGASWLRLLRSTWSSLAPTTRLDIGGRNGDGPGEWTHRIHSKMFLVKVHPSPYSELQILLPVQTLHCCPHYLLYQLHCIPNLY